MSIICFGLEFEYSQHKIQILQGVSYNMTPYEITIWSLGWYCAPSKVVSRYSLVNRAGICIFNIDKISRFNIDRFQILAIKDIVNDITSIWLIAYVIKMYSNDLKFKKYEYQ